MQINYSALYKGKIFHWRTIPVKNKFNYPMHLFAIDLDNLSQLESLNYLGINSFSFFSLRDEDHLQFWKKKGNSEKVKSGHSMLSHRIRDYLNKQYPNLKVSRIVLLTNLRILGFVFNPVSFYYIYEQVGSKEEVRFVLAEVNNTYGEQRMFLIDGIEEMAKFKKLFYVSPFIPFDSEFHFYFNQLDENLFIRIDSIQENSVILKAILSGEREVISDLALLKILLQFPFYSMFILGRIHWQALKLFFKKVPYFGKVETDKLIYGIGEIHGKNS